MFGVAVMNLAHSNLKRAEDQMLAVEPFTVMLSYSLYREWRVCEIPELIKLLVEVLCTTQLMPGVYLRR